MTMDGRVAVVTGGASGIGKATCEALAAAGARTVVADLAADRADEVAAAIGASGGAAFGAALDVTDPASLSSLRTMVEEEYGIVDCVVNCAGYDVIQPFLDNEPGDWQKLVAVNYLGTVAVCHEFLRPLVDAGRPANIVNVASDAGRVGSTGETVYAGSKGAVIAFTKSLAREMARYKINVNAVSPGPTDTPMFYGQPPKMQEALIRAIPLRRLGEPAEVAAAIKFLASDDAAYITGQVLSVSGGLTMVD